MKKIILVLIATFLMSALLTACTSNAAATQGVEPAPSEAVSDTRIIKTVKGDVEIPANPERVIISYFEGDLLALGIKPIATEPQMEGAAFSEVYSNPRTIGYEFEEEEVMTLDPDLIIVISEEHYEKLNKIAPTIYIPFTEMSTNQRIKMMGEIFGKEKEAQALIDGFEVKVEEAKAKLIEAGILDKTVTLLGPSADEIWVFGDKWGRGGDIIYSYLGFKAPQPIQEKIIGGEQWKSISMEVLPEYCGDYIFIALQPGEKNPLAGKAVWESLSAVKNNHVLYHTEGFLYYMDMYSMSKQLDTIVDDLIKASEAKDGAAQ